MSKFGAEHRRSKSTAPSRPGSKLSSTTAVVSSALGMGSDTSPRREESSRMIAQIHELEVAIGKKEEEFNDKITSLIARCQVSGQSEIIDHVMSLKRSADEAVAEYRKKYETALKAFKAMKAARISLTVDGEEEIKTKVYELYRPFLSSGNAAMRYESSGTLSSFVSLPVETSPLLEQINVLERQLNNLITDYETRYQDLIAQYVVANRRVGIAEEATVKTRLNIIGVIGDAIEKRQIVSSAKEARKGIMDRLKDNGYSAEKARMYEAAKNSVRKLKKLKERLLELHHMDYIRPERVTPLHEVATQFNSALQVRDEKANDIFKTLEELVDVHTGAVGPRLTMDEFLAKDPDSSEDELVTTPISALSATISEIGTRSPASASSGFDAHCDVEPLSPVPLVLASNEVTAHVEEPIVRKDLERSRRTRFSVKDLNAAICTAVNEYCKTTGMNPGVFSAGKPDIDFTKFLEKYFPHPQYGPKYRERFGVALESAYERTTIGKLISLMEQKKVEEIALKAGVGFRVLDSDSDSDSDIGSRGKRSRSVTRARQGIQSSRL